MRIPALFLAATLSLFASCVSAESASTAPNTGFSPSVVKFLAQCTDMDASKDDVQPVATASCMMLIRGLVDGHKLTVELFYTRVIQFKRMYPDKKVIDVGFRPVWCVPRVQNGELFVAVVRWIDTHEEEFEQISTLSRNTTSAAYATITAGLKETFPCPPVR